MVIDKKGKCISMSIKIIVGYVGSNNYNDTGTNRPWVIGHVALINEIIFYFKIMFIYF